MAVKLTKIGFLADTHVRKNDGSDFPEAAIKALQGVDLIVHLGDIGKKDVILTRLGEVAPVMIQSEDRKGYVYAANPGAPVTAIDVGTHSVGVTFNLAQPDKKVVVQDDTIEFLDDFGKLMTRRFKQPVNVVAFAATRASSMTYTHDNTLFFNPGSPTLPMEPPGTLAILDVSKKTPAVKIVSL